VVVRTERFNGSWEDRWASGGTRRWGLEKQERTFLSDSPGVKYTPRANAWVRTRKPMRFRGLTGCQVKYKLQLSTQKDHDFLFVEASTDKSRWRRLNARSGTTHRSWVTKKDSLARYDGRRHVFLRFRLHSDETVQRNGAGLDNISVSCVPESASGTPVTFMGAGDIAACGDWSGPNARANGNLIEEAKPDFVFTTGDNAYDDGTPQQYQDCYDPVWGSFKAKTLPTPGNHDYHSDPPKGYIGYFGRAKVTNDEDGGLYYARDLGNGWRYYALNTEVSSSSSSPQLTWLKADLAANKGKHIVAALHRTRYSPGTVHGSSTSPCELWDALQAAHADILLTGHDHLYARYGRLDCDGKATSAGIRQFLVGNGGNQLYDVDPSASPKPEAVNGTDFGVLKLKLYPGSYEWQFIASGRGWNGEPIKKSNKGAILDKGSDVTHASPAAAPSAAAARAGFPTSRDPYEWPFRARSIWNMPLGSDAVYVDAGLRRSGARQTQPDEEFIGLDPTDPVKKLTSEEDGALGKVHVPADMSWDGRWNGAAVFLRPDGDTVWQGQPLVLSPGGNPRWTATTPSSPVSLTKSKGILGAHGGSGLSAIGGSIRAGELPGRGRIRHALKINIDCAQYCYYAGVGHSHRWPAVQEDDPLDRQRYGGSNPSLVPGALLALPPGFHVKKLRSHQGRKIAWTLKNYGAYVVDETAGDYYAFAVEVDALDEWHGGRGWFAGKPVPAVMADLQTIYPRLKIIDNNGPKSIGGGGTRRQPLAPPFAG
jgi:hypothetical protein